MPLPFELGSGSTNTVNVCIKGYLNLNAPIAEDNEYAGYGNWTKFTENCFCIKRICSKFCMQKHHTFQFVATVKMYDYDEF